MGGVSDGGGDGVRGDGGRTHRLAVIAALSHRFEPDVVQQKPAFKGGRPMPYISHGLVTKRLNAHAPGWSSRILGREVVTVPVIVERQRVDKTFVEVTLELSLPDGAYHQELGVAEVGRDYGTAAKAAASDALKRAAMRFGVALYLWESLEEQDEDATTETPTPRAGATPGREPAPRSSPQRPTPSERPAALGTAAGPPSPDVAQALVPNGAGGMRTVDVPMDDDLPAKPGKRAPTVAEALAAAGNETLSAKARQYAAVRGLEACPTLDDCADYYVKVLPLAPEREALAAAYKARNEALRVEAGAFRGEG